MKTFIQLKDGIGWASITTHGEIKDGIEVDLGTGDFYIKKKYADGVWTEADLIQYAEVNNEGEIIEIKRTYYSSEVDGPILTADTKLTSKWINDAWANPVVVDSVKSTVIDLSPPEALPYSEPLTIEGESNVQEASN